MGVLCGVMGVGARRLRLERVPRAGRGRRRRGARLAENQRQRRLHIEPKRGSDLRSQRRAARGERRGAEHRRRRRRDAPRRRRRAARRRSCSSDVAGAHRRGARRSIRNDVDDEARDEAPLRLAQAPRLRRRGAGGARSRRSEEAGEAASRASTIEGEGHRYYPGRELAGPVLGFVAPDGEGKDGLELVARRRAPRPRRRGARPPRSLRAPPLLRGRRPTSRRSPGTTSTSRSTRASSTSPSASSTRRMGPTRRRAASVVVVDPNTGEILAIASAPGYNPNDYGESEVDARRDRAVTDRFEPGSRHEGLHGRRGARRRHAEADRDDLLRARHVPGRQRHHPRHARERLAHADADPREELEHRRAQDRPRPRRAAALRGVSSLRLRRADGLAASRRGGGRAPSEGPPVVRGRDGERVVRSGHQRHHGAARDGDGRDRQRRRLLEPILVTQVTDGTRRRRSRRGAARAARGRAAARREDSSPRCSSRSPKRAAPASRPRCRASASPARRRPRRRSIRRRASTPQDKYTASFVGFVPAEQAAPRHRGRARRADDRALRRRSRGPGVPARRRGEPALPRRVRRTTHAEGR